MSAFTIAQISDLHCGSPHFVPSLLERAIEEINELAPDVVIVSGDLTADGFREEYDLAREYIDRLDCEGPDRDPRQPRLAQRRLRPLRGAVRRAPPRAATCDGVSIVAMDSSEPDLDHGTIGRGRYGWIEERFASQEADLRIFVLHHHLLPIPGTGRERNIVHDAGDVLECLLRSGVHLVLSGHKHVPYAWRLENLFVVNAGTASTTRVRGQDEALLQRDRGDAASASTVFRKYPFHDREPIISFDPRTQEYEKDPSLLGETARGEP